MKRINVLLFIFIFAVLSFGSVLNIFYSYDCDHCELILNGELKELLHEFDPEYRYYEVTNKKNMDILYELERVIDRAAEDFPEVIIGAELYYGEELGSDEFIEYVGSYPITSPKLQVILDRGTFTKDPFWTKPSDTAASDTTIAKMYMAYFYAKGCSHCRKTDKMLEVMKQTYPLEVDYFELPEHILLFEAMEERFEIPEKNRLGYPKIFIRDRVFFEDEVEPGPISEFIEALTTEATPWWRDIDTQKDAKRNILTRFGKFRLSAVIIGGLIDGINPCAFTTILFFISFLTLIKRTKKEVLITGISFCTAIFLSYLLIGIGLVAVLRSLNFIEALSKILYLVMGIIVLVFAVLSFFDYFKFKAGKSGEAILQLPDYLKKKAHSIIRKGKSAKNIWISAFITGILISLVEFACTGQVYLPTITFVMKVPELRVRAFLFLVIYNLFFILPLIVVFLLTYLGFSSQTFNNTYKKLGPSVKVITGVFFLILGGMLIYLSL